MDYGLHGANPERFIDGLVYDFSTNTNVIKKRFKISKKNAYSYPSIEVDELKCLLKYENENILFTNGINEAIYIIASLYNKVSILQPTYVEYERALTGFGKEITHLYNLDVIDTECIFICNPNNPTGEYRDLSNIIKSNPNTMFVIDESYIDFVENPFEIDYLLKNVILLRSLTKTYHLSGLRLGYVLSNEELIKTINDKKPTWSVNSFAIEVGKQMLSDENFIKKTKKYYLKEKEYFTGKLRELGVEVVDSSVHYFLLKISNSDFIPFMLKHRIFVRHTNNFKGLNGNYIRICTRTRKENKYFLKIIKKYRRIYEN